MTVFFMELCVHLEHLLGWERVYVCHNLRTGKEAFEVNSHNLQEEIGIQVAFMLEINLQKYIF